MPTFLAGIRHDSRRATPLWTLNSPTLVGGAAARLPCLDLDLCPHPAGLALPSRPSRSGYQGNPEELLSPFGSLLHGVVRRTRITCCAAFSGGKHNSALTAYQQTRLRWCVEDARSHPHSEPRLRWIGQRRGPSARRFRRPASRERRLRPPSLAAHNPTVPCQHCFSVLAPCLKRINLTGRQSLPATSASTHPLRARLGGVASASYPRHQGAQPTQPSYESYSPPRRVSRGRPIAWKPNTRLGRPL